MNPTDNQVCQYVLRELMSDKYTGFHNYLFLEPVDLANFPDYTSIVKKPMDLGTVSSNFKKGVYATKEEVLSDITTCFDNAGLYHHGKPETKWVIDSAKKLKKFMKKELNNALASQSQQQQHLPTMTNKQNQRLTTSTTAKASGTGTGTTERKKKKKSSSSSSSEITKTPKTKLSLKLNTSSSSKSTNQSTTSPKPTSNNTNNVVSTSSSSSISKNAASTTAANTTTSKSKLKLKIGTKKSSSSTSIPTPISSATESRKIAPPTTSTSNSDITTNNNTNNANTVSEIKTKSKKPSSTPKSTQSGPSRGKELPSAIAAAKKESKKSKNNNNTDGNNNTSGNSDAKGARTNTKSPTESTNIGITASSNITPKGASSSNEKSQKGNSEKSQKSNKLRLSLPKNENTTASSSQPVKAEASKSPGGRRTPVGRSTPKSSSSSMSGVIVGAMTPNYKAQCSKVLSALKHREREEEVGWFLKPVKKSLERVMFEDYQNKVPIPMDIGTMSTKLDKNKYNSVSDFAHDLRRIFANCLRYNTNPNDKPFRDLAKAFLESTDKYMYMLIQHPVSSSKNIYPTLLYCWTTCLDILNRIVYLESPEDKGQTAWFFLQPVTYFFGGTLPAEYQEKVKKPMDFGTITSNLIEGIYQNVDSFVKDCRLVTTNCKAYYVGRDDDVMYAAQANRLEQYLSPQLDQLEKYDKSQQGQDARKAFKSPDLIKLLKPTKPFYNSMLEDLRRTTYTDKYTKITEPAVSQFENPVDTSLIQDYLQFVNTPMDLLTIRNKVATGVYKIPEDFEYDVNLIFKNCEAYNIPKRNDHIVNLAKHCAKIFKKMYASRIRAFEASGGKKLFGDDNKKDKKRSLESTTPTIAPPPPKKMRQESTSAKQKSPGPTSASQQAVPKGKSPKPTGGKRVVPRIVIKTDGPMPLHVAIAKIKEGFKCRRQHKELQSWEGACSRFFRELKRHPWVGSSKRFVFDAPVPMLHPEIKAVYLNTIKSPMDLTTAECKLLQGGIYKHPQEFVDDVALVFANAVTFNKSGDEQGDPTSCAYFDASRHLLRYTRWLSLEYLSAFLFDDSQNEGERQTGPLPHWKLTVSNLNDSRYEMENVVFKQLLDKSEDGDRVTWMESECEKLLKSLRHQTDQKRMTFFIREEYPLDYDQYIKKRVWWMGCETKLKEWKYDTFGELISDLRLIFENALKYNGRVKDYDTTSKDAYESALHMSGKLEVAIQKLYLTAGDRIEREKIEDIILDREAEIAQRAEEEEEERIRSELLKQRERSRNSGVEPSRSSIATPSLKIRRAPRRDLDFDNPFDDQEGSHEQTEMEVINKQKNIYEKQLRDRALGFNVTKNVGIRIYHNLFWRSQAIGWSKQISERIQQTLAQQNIEVNAEKLMETGEEPKCTPKPSLVASLLHSSGRSQVKMALSKPVKRKNKRKRLFLG